jgi:DNA-directed RNA polymerase subunit F
VSEEEKYVPVEVARKLISEIVDEEHLHEANRRVLTVYGPKGRELCWFDAEDVMKEIGAARADEKSKEAAVEYIFHHLPLWAVEDIIKEMGGR